MDIILDDFGNSYNDNNLNENDMLSKPSPKRPPSGKRTTGFSKMTKKELREQLDIRHKENGIKTGFFMDGGKIIDPTKKDLLEEINSMDGKEVVVVEPVVNGTSGNASAVTMDSETQEPIFILEDRHQKVIDKFIKKTTKYISELNETKNTDIDIETDLLDVFLDTPILKK